MFKFYFIIIIHQLIQFNAFNMRKILEERKTTSNYCQQSPKSLYCRNRIVFYIILGISLLGTILGVIYLVLSCISKSRKRRNYSRNRTRRITAYSLITNRIGNEILIQKKISYLFTKVLKPTFFSKENTNKYNICPVCLEKYTEGSEICITPCNHCFHFICIRNYAIMTKNSSCPLCKFDYLSILDGKKINYENIEIITLKNNNNDIDKNNEGIQESNGENSIINGDNFIVMRNNNNV